MSDPNSASIQRSTIGIGDRRRAIALCRCHEIACCKEVLPSNAQRALRGQDEFRSVYAC